MSREVDPVTSPVITRLSASPVAKFALMEMVPPPAKLPVTVSLSATSLSLPTSIVPVTLRLFTVRPCVPLPKLIVEPAPTLSVSHPLRFESRSVPATPMSESVLESLAPEAVSVPMPSMLVRSKVRSSEESDSRMLPESVAPLSITMLSQPASPPDTTLS